MLFAYYHCVRPLSRCSNHTLRISCIARFSAIASTSYVVWVDVNAPTMCIAIVLLDKFRPSEGLAASSTKRPLRPKKDVCLVEHIVWVPQEGSQ